MFSGLGVLAGGPSCRACIPLSIRLHDGLKAAANWEGACISTASHVVQMVEDAYRAADVLGACLLLLDRYFLSVPALQRLRERNGSGTARMEIVTKARKSCTAYEKLAPKKPGKGRVSEGAMMCYLRKHFFLLTGQQPRLRITRIIRQYQDKSGIYWDSLAS